MIVAIIISFIIGAGVGISAYNQGMKFIYKNASKETIDSFIKDIKERLL